MEGKGDWIPMRHGLLDDPAVIELALACSIPVVHAIGCCFAVWRWADRNYIDGRLEGATEQHVDHVAGVPGFGAAMLTSGWLIPMEGSSSLEEGLEVPKWAEYFAPSAKGRLMATVRMQKSRARHSRDGVVTPLSVTEPSRDRHATVTQSQSQKKRKNSPTGSEKERAPRTPPTRKRPGSWSTIPEGLELVQPSEALRAAWQLRLQGLLERPQRDRPTGTALRAQGVKCERLAQDTAPQAAVDLLAEATEGGWKGLPPEVVADYAAGTRAHNNQLTSRRGGPVSQQIPEKERAAQSDQAAAQRREQRTQWDKDAAGQPAPLLDGLRELRQKQG